MSCCVVYVPCVTSRVQSVVLYRVGPTCYIKSAECRDVSCRVHATSRVQSVVLCRVGPMCDITSAECRIVSSRAHVLHQECRVS